MQYSYLSLSFIPLLLLCTQLIVSISPGAFIAELKIHQFFHICTIECTKTVFALCIICRDSSFTRWIDGCMDGLKLNLLLLPHTQQIPQRHR